MPMPPGAGSAATVMSRRREFLAGFTQKQLQSGRSPITQQPLPRCSHRLAVRTSPSHGENWGSIPHGSAIGAKITCFKGLFSSFCPAGNLGGTILVAF